MTGMAFDIQLIPEFNGAMTDMLNIVEWIENVELVYKLCYIYEVVIMTLEQLLTQAHAIVTDNQRCVLVATNE